MTRRVGSFHDLSRRIPSAMRSDFGRVIENLMDLPGAWGAVLVDDDGYAIDYVYDPRRLTELDIQLIGAQVGHAAIQLQASAQKLDLGTPAAIVEGKQGALIIGPVGLHYVLTFVLRPDADPIAALALYEAVRSTVEHLLI